MPRSARPGKKGLYVEIPEELGRLLDEQVERERRPKTTVVIMALERYLGIGDQPPDLTPADLAALDRANDRVGREMDEERKAAQKGKPAGKGKAR